MTDENICNNLGLDGDMFDVNNNLTGNESLFELGNKKNA